MTGADLIALLKKQPVGSVCALVSLICVALYFVRGGAIDEQTVAGEQRSAELSKILSNVRNSAGLPEQLAEIQAASKEISSRLIRENQRALNLQYFYRLESETGVKLVDVRQGALPSTRGAAASPFVGIPFSVSIEGSFKQTMDFLKKIEASPSYTRFNTLTLARINSGDGAGRAAGPADITVSMNIDLLGQP